MDAGQKEKLEKIASLILHGVPLEQVADAVGLSLGRVAQIKEEKEYGEIYQKLASEHFEKYQDMNDGWDLVESMSQAVLLENLKWNKNPDFALKAAMVANKATRRGQHANNQPIPAGRAGAAVIINLNTRFVTGKETLDISAHPQAQTIDGKVQSKQINMMPPTQVEQLLRPEAEKDISEINLDYLHSRIATK